MNRIFTMIFWRWKLLFSNWKLIIISLSIPILLSMAVGHMFKDYDGINSIPVGIIDEDNTKMSMNLIQDISNSNTLKPIIFSDKSTAINRLQNDQIEALFVIKPDFAEHIKTGNLNKSIELSYLENNRIAGALGDIFARNIVKATSPYKAANHVYKLTKDDALYDKTYNRVVEHLKDPKFSLIVNSSYSSSVTKDKNPRSSNISVAKTIANRFAIGMTLAVSAFYIMYIGSSAIIERNSSVFARIYSTGQNPNFLLFLGYASFSSLVVFLQLIFLNLSLGIFPYAQLPIIFMYTLGFCSAFTIISLAISSLFKNPISYQSVSTPLIFFICLFGGAFWSLELIPTSIRWIQYLSPVYWFIEKLL